MTDAELRTFLWLDNVPDADAARVLAKITPEQRAVYERMHEVTEASNRGEVPEGVLVDFPKVRR